MSKRTKKYNFSGKDYKEVKDSEDNDPLMLMPMSSSYFEKLPKGMEPQTWIRLKTILAMRIPPSPVLGDYPMSFHDKWWSLQNIEVKGRIMNMLIYNYKHKHEEDGISASLLFDQVAVTQRTKSGNTHAAKAYNVLNIKFAMYDVEISENVSIRLTPNPV